MDVPDRPGCTRQVQAGVAVMLFDIVIIVLLLVLVLDAWLEWRRWSS